MLLCITAVVALPDCLGVFWISKKRGCHPPGSPSTGCVLFNPMCRFWDRFCGCCVRGDGGGTQIHLLHPGVPILPASWNTHGTATELPKGSSKGSQGCPSPLGHPVPSWGYEHPINHCHLYSWLVAPPLYK